MFASAAHRLTLRTLNVILAAEFEHCFELKESALSLQLQVMRHFGKCDLAFFLFLANFLPLIAADRL